MKMKRILASLLAFMMLLGTMGVTVFAEGEEYKLPVAEYKAITGDALDVYNTGVALLDFGGTFAVKDMDKYMTTADYNYYRLNPVDFEVTFSNSGHALLLGQYDLFNEMWIPATDIFSGGKGDLVYFEANKPFRVMDEGTGGAFKDFITLKQICEEIKVFNCGVMFADMPAGTTATLDLCMYDRTTGEKIATFGSFEYEGYEAKKNYAVCIDMGSPFGNVEFPLQAESIKQIMSLLDDQTNDLADTYTIKLYNDVTVDETFSVPEGENITIDLNGNTLNLSAGGNDIKGDIKFTNGTIDISGLHYNGDSILMVNGLDSDIAFENVLIQGDGYTSPAGFINLRAAQQTVTITNSTVDLKNEGDQNNGAFINCSASDAVVTVNNSDITLYNTRAGFVIANTTLTNSTYVVDGNQHAFNNLASLTIADSDVKVTNSTESGMKLGSGSVSITGDSNVVITGSANGDIIHRSDATTLGSIDVAGTASLTVENAAESVIEKTTGTIVNKAEKIAVAFKKDENDETGRSYFIVLMGAEGKTINDFESAHFTFENGNKANIDYTITPNADLDITAVDDITNPDRISFYRNADENNTNEIAAEEIILGTVRFEGYGKVNFSIKDADAKVNATTAMDNIVDTFIPTSDINKLYVNWADADTADKYVPSITDELKEATRSLNVKLSFNNDVAKTNDACYNDMTVTVTGTNGYIKTGKIGTKCAEAPADVYAQVGDDNVATLVFTGENALPAGYRYTVKVEGAGYRTAEYTTVVGTDSTDDVTLTFWNNVKDEFNKTEIESGSDRWYTKNFLAGEIVQDNKINKYDLAAVVSYFGEDDLVASRPEYNKYDLNRDGVIDSEDIAYVLVSFGE